MAEQKVCDEITSKSKEGISEKVEGESLLLPLLQGLLDAPDNEQTADSGTESGEDLRNGLLIEVQNVLSKLAVSLKSDSIEMTPDRRNSLLQLVTRLQTGLSVQPSNGGERRNSSGSGRFTRRKRQNRHTVGVSSEELEDARKLIEEFRLRDSANSSSSTKVQIPLQKQHSEGNYINQNIQHKITTVKNNKPTVKNAVAKPYNNSGTASQSHSGASSTVDTPTDTSEIIEFTKPNFEPNCIDPTKSTKSFYPKSRPLSEIIPSVTSIKMENNVSPELKRVLTSQNSMLIENNAESDTEDAYKLINRINDNVRIPSYNPTEYKASITLQNNPIYSQPQPIEDDTKNYNKFAYKKQKMKRANTIDIPKPITFQEGEDDYDSDSSLVGKQNKRNNYLALRGPIRVGNKTANNSNVVPVFEPKTDSDRKFMAFINQHNDSLNKGSMWAYQKDNFQKKPENNWNNRFGHIRTAFEKASTSTPSTPTSNINSARNFWKSTEGSMMATKQKLNNIQEFTKHQQQPVLTDGEEESVVTGTLKVETKGFDANKSYKLVSQPLPVNKFSHATTSAFASIPKKGNFEVPLTYHTQSVFKPISQPFVQPTDEQIEPKQKNGLSENVIKLDFNESDSCNSTPLYLYSPKPVQSTAVPSSTTTSPSQAPWTGSVNKSRVQKLVSSKFENNDVIDELPFKSSNLRRVSSKSSFPTLTPSNEPIIKRSDETNTVKKISSQFNCKNVPTLDNTYTARATLKYDHPPSEFQHLSNYKPQNYSIVYDKPRQQLSANKILQNDLSKKFNVETNADVPRRSSHGTSENGPIHRLSQSYLQNYNAKVNQPEPKLTRTSFTSKSPFDEAEFLNKKQNYTENPELSQNYVAKVNQPDSKLNRSSFTSKSPFDEAEFLNKKRSYMENPEPLQNYTAKVNQSDSKLSRGASLTSKSPFDEVEFLSKKRNYLDNPEPLQNYTAKVNQPDPKLYRGASLTSKSPFDEAELLNKRRNYSENPEPTQNYNAKVNQSDPKLSRTSFSSKSPFDEMEFLNKKRNYLENPETDFVSNSSVKLNQTSSNKTPTSVILPEVESSIKNRQYQTQLSQESLKEYEAAQTRVMKGPISHQAVTVQQKFPKGRDEHDMEAAFNLKSVLQKFTQSDDKLKLSDRKLSMDSAVSEQNKKITSDCNLLKTQSFKKYYDTKSNKIGNPPNFLVNGNSLSHESTEVNENGESVITSKFHIPVTVSKTREMFREATEKRSPPQQILSKTESCHQLAYDHQDVSMSNRHSPNSKFVIKSKSTHTLAVPTLQYQAGMTRDEVAQKRRTVEAYFSGGTSPQSISRSPSDDSLDKNERAESKANKSSINRKKTSEKVSTHKQNCVARSRTLPNIVCPNLLDESNVEASFDDLFKSNA